MSDLITEMFDGDADFYPGSKKRRNQPTQEDARPQRDRDWRETYTLKTLRGKETPMYTIGSLAEALEVSIPTIRSWIKKGYIPQAPYRLPSNMIVNGEATAGRRLYTEELIDLAVQVFQKHGLLGKSRIVWADQLDVTRDISLAWAKSVAENNN